MPLRHLFTSTQGRIGRASFWLGAVILFVAALLLATLSIAFGLGIGQSYTQIVTIDGEPVGQRSGTVYAIHPWVGFAIILLGIIPFAIMAVKRRHDRDFEGWDIYGFVGLVFVNALLTALGTGGTLAHMLVIVQFVWCVCLLILLGCLRGTIGPNRFGADPVPKAAA